MKSALNVPDAPQALGPYSQAQIIRMHGGNRMVFTSGQVPIDPATGELVDGDIGAQTERIFRNIEAVLAGANLALADIVKTTVYLADMGDFAPMNEAYAREFEDDPPARSTIAVAGLPKGARVEIEAIAVGRDL